MEELLQRLYLAEAKNDALFLALRALLELQQPDMRIAFTQNFSALVKRNAEIALASVASDSHLAEIDAQARKLTNRLVSIHGG